MEHGDLFSPSFEFLKPILFSTHRKPVTGHTLREFSMKRGARILFYKHSIKDGSLVSFISLC